MAFEELLMEYEERRAKAVAMGGPEKLEKRRAAGLLNARERIDYLVDPGSFIESGLFGTSAAYEHDREKTPADGKVAGYARLGGRDIAVISNDFTGKGASRSVLARRARSAGAV